MKTGNSYLIRKMGATPSLIQRVKCIEATTSTYKLQFDNEHHVYVKKEHVTTQPFTLDDWELVEDLGELEQTTPQPKPVRKVDEDKVWETLKALDTKKITIIQAHMQLCEMEMV